MRPERTLVGPEVPVSFPQFLIIADVEIDRAIARGIPVASAGGLVDMTVLDNLRPLTGTERVGEMVREGLVAYADCCAVMLEPQTSDSDIRSYAHKLKRSSWTLGLRRLSVIAHGIEQAGDEGPVLAGRVHELKTALEATRHELTRLGVVRRTAP